MILNKLITNFLMFFLGALGCFYLQRVESISAVLASALTGLIATFFPWQKFKIKADSAAVIYCGSFASMCSINYLSSLPQVFYLSLIGGVIISVGSSALNGHGGKLGTMAFISVLLFLLVGRLI